MFTFVKYQKISGATKYTAKDINGDYSTDYLGDRDYLSFTPYPNCGKKVSAPNV